MLKLSRKIVDAHLNCVTRARPQFLVQFAILENIERVLYFYKLFIFSEANRHFFLYNNLVDADMQPVSDYQK
jgi:hypothetical protein